MTEYYSIIKDNDKKIKFKNDKLDKEKQKN